MDTDSVENALQSFTEGEWDTDVFLNLIFLYSKIKHSFEDCEETDRNGRTQHLQIVYKTHLLTGLRLCCNVMKQKSEVEMLRSEMI